MVRVIRGAETEATATQHTDLTEEAGERSERMDSWLASPETLTFGWLAASVVGVAAGGALWVAGIERGADIAWGLTTAVAALPLMTGVVRGLIRMSAGVDVIAALAIGGSLVLDEYLAGAIIGLMLATGRALEGFANRRARRDLSALLERAPRTVTRY